jgi:hypothetical protein
MLHILKYLLLTNSFGDLALRLSDAKTGRFRKYKGMIGRDGKPYLNVVRVRVPKLILSQFTSSANSSFPP